MEKNKLTSSSAEGMLVGSFYLNPHSILDYEDKLKPYDKYFTDKNTQFLYKMFLDLYYVKKHNVISEVKINMYLDESSKQNEEQYKSMGGYKTLKMLMNRIDIKEINSYYEKVLKYAILRDLYKNEFPVHKIIDDIDLLSPQQVIDAFESKLNEVSINIKGVNDSTILGKNMLDIYESYKESPDIGVPIPFPIINDLMRGWRLNTLNMIGGHSGMGKSRIMSRVISYMGVEKQIPIVLIVNEQDIEEWNQMLLSSVVNNLFGKKVGVYINERKIATGTCNKLEDKLCKQAAKYIEKNSKIYFQELSSWDYDTIKKVLKKHKMRGCNHFVYDTFKPFRSSSLKGVSSWEAFVQTAEMLKEIVGSRDRGGLNMGGFITFQLTDDSLFNDVLTSQSIANGKHIKHCADFLMMFRPLKHDEKLSYSFKNEIGEGMSLNQSKEYYMMFVDKSRSSESKLRILFEGHRGYNVWDELGYAVENE